MGGWANVAADVGAELESASLCTARPLDGWKVYDAWKVCDASQTRPLGSGAGTGRASGHRLRGLPPM